MVNIASGKYLTLNETASFVWHLLEQRHSEDALVERLMARYAVDEDHCRHALAALLGQMQSLRMVLPV